MYTRTYLQSIAVQSISYSAYVLVERKCLLAFKDHLQAIAEKERESASALKAAAGAHLIHFLYSVLLRP